MINILIIEDNPEKHRAVLGFLEKECNVSESDIDCADNVNLGRDFLTKNSYDLLLLDLVLPINEGDSPSAESGTRFLDEIYYNPNINIPLHIIGLTEYDKAFKESAKDFEDKLWGLVNFSLQTMDWKDKIKCKVFYLQKTKTDYRKFIEVEKKFDVAIITALNKEFEELKNICKWEEYPVPNDPLVYYKLTLNTKNSNNIKIIACCINDMGMQATSAVTSKVISTFSPKYIFMTGICAGLKSSGVNIGGIIVAKQVWDYESGKIIDNVNGDFTFKPDMKCLTTDQGIITRLTEFSNNKTILSNIYNDFKGNKPNTHLDVKFDSVGSGPYLLSSKNYLKRLLENDRKLIGIDMEGFGMYKAAQFHQGTIPIFVKAVSDFGDTKKEDSYQSFASYASARFVYEYLYDFL